jgi:hypothetical protein
MSNSAGNCPSDRSRAVARPQVIAAVPIRRPRLSDPEPAQELHRDIDAGTHRFVVCTLHIDPIVALL